MKRRVVADLGRGESFGFLDRCAAETKKGGWACTEREVSYSCVILFEGLSPYV